MRAILDSLKKAVEQENWYSALALALAVPDICGWLNDPTMRIGDRYRAWFTKYLLGLYSRDSMPQQAPDGTIFRGPYTFLSGSDCYALRCAFLHQGGEDISDQNAQELLERFQFRAPAPNGNSVHRNIFGGKLLQLEVNRFCKEILDAAEVWLVDVSMRPEVVTRMNSMLKIYPGRSGL